MLDKKPLPEALEGPDPQRHHWPEPAAPTPVEEREVYPGEGVVFKEGLE
jgi:hypothetical protein